MLLSTYLEKGPLPPLTYNTDRKKHFDTLAAAMVDLVKVDGGSVLYDERPTITTVKGELSMTPLLHGAYIYSTYAPDNWGYHFNEEKYRRLTTECSPVVPTDVVANKYKLNKVDLVFPKDKLLMLAVLPADNFKDIVDYAKIQSYIRFGRAVYIKPHPETTTTMLRRLREMFGETRVLQPGVDILPYIQNHTFHEVMATSTSELGLIAALGATTIVDITKAEHFIEGMYAGFYGHFWYGGDFKLRSMMRVLCDMRFVTTVEEVQSTYEQLYKSTISGS